MQEEILKVEVDGKGYYVKWEDWQKAQQFNPVSTRPRDRSHSFHQIHTGLGAESVEKDIKGSDMELVFEEPKYTQFKLSLNTDNEDAAKMLRMEIIKALGSDGWVEDIRKEEINFVFHKGCRDFYVLTVHLKEDIRIFDLLERTSITKFKHLLI